MYFSLQEAGVIIGYLYNLLDNLLVAIAVLFFCISVYTKSAEHLVVE